MVSFDHRDEGTPEEAWLTDPRWQDVPALHLAEHLERLVVVSAHPDDESLGAAGLIRRASASGASVHVVVATDGAASHPDSPTVTGEGLARVRQEELRRAVALLAPDATVEFLGLPDGRLRTATDALVERLRALALDDRALVVVPWRADGHGDHEAAGAAVAGLALETGAHLLEYPVWMWHWAAPADSAVPWGRFVTLALDEDEQRLKADAIAAHASQNAPLSPHPGDEVLLSDRFHDYFRRPFEVYIAPTGAPTLEAEFFDSFYAGRDDPWGFETRWYEVRKRAITVASLPRPLFASALEVGCSIGVLTEELAGRCASLVATDIAEQPLARARARLAGSSHVTLLHADAAREWPPGSFDLVVLSEVAYYWSEADLARILTRIDDALTADGVLVACHWRHPVAGYPERGDDVHAAIRSHPAFAVLAEHREEDFRLDVLVRPPARSVAREAGLVR